MEDHIKWQGPFIFSAIFSLFLWQIPPFSLMFILFAVSLYLLWRRKLIMSGFLCGFSWFFLHAHLATAWHLPKQFIKQSIEIIATVDQIPVTSAESIKLTLKLQSLGGIEQSVLFTPKARVNWRLNKKAPSKLSLKNKPIPKLGDKVKLYAKLKPAHGFANIGGFSYQKWLLTKSIHATGYVDSRLPVIIIHDQNNKRQQLFDRLALSIKDLPYGGLLMALAMGDKQLISQTQWQYIRASGIGHLLAISGLHIGMMFVFARFIGLWLIKSYNYLLATSINAHKYALLVGLLGAGFYAYLAGFAIPTLRALLMLSLLVLLLASSRQFNARSVVFHSLTAILIINPLALLEPGLWLSYGAVISIMLLFWWFKPKDDQQKPKLWLYCQSLLKIQLVLFITLMPLSALIFNGFSASGSWVNLIAVPWVCFTTVPLTVAAMLFEAIGISGRLLLQLADGTLALLFELLRTPWASNGWHSFPFIPWYTWALAIIALIMMLIPVGKKLRLLSTALLLPALLGYPLVNNIAPFANGNDKQWTMQVFDVGQGLAVGIEKNNQIMLYDLGPRYKSGFNTAKQVILPYLHHHNFNAVDFLIISHGDSDHAGGYQDLLKQIRVNRIIAPDNLNINQPVQQCQPSQFNWQGLTVRILSPIPTTVTKTITTTMANTKTVSSNDSSCVIQVGDDSHQVLLTGDISTRVERQLVKQYGKSLKSDVILAPHHGSNSSSSGVFIRLVEPQYVVYSSGFYNRYRFPRPKVVSRYQQYDVKGYTTAETGQITFNFTPQLIEVLPQRQHQLKQWFNN